MKRDPDDDRKPEREFWIEEDQHEVFGMRYLVRRTLYSESSPYQQISIVESAGYGRMLINDGVVMISERDERVYHEMIAHVPLYVRPETRRVLVVGGGDGGTVREVLRHASVTHCRLVEIDAKVVEGCRRHIPQTAAALDDPRVQVSIADGVEFVADCAERYDLVIVDSSDPVGPAVPLFGAEFYGNVQRILADDGVVISQAESPFYEAEAQASLARILREHFRRVHFYNYSNLTYPGGLLSFSFATKGSRCPLGGFDPRRVERSGLRFHYYTPALHRAAFALPAFQLENLGDVLTPLDDRDRAG